MITKDSVTIEDYNKFCSNLKEGCILYNIDSTNNWGDYLLVVNISAVRVSEQKTYTVLLLGLRKEKDKLVSRNTRIKLIPDYAQNIPFLKPVGYCDFKLIPALDNVKLNIGLATVYGSMDLHKFARNLSIRKPKKRKFGVDGKPIVKKAENED